MKMAALYARVSSDKQKEDRTIASQIAELLKFAEDEGFVVPEDWIFKDEGYSGSILVRPALEQLRDLAAQGELESLLILSPDRLSRRHAYQVLLLEEFSRNGVEVLFKNAPRGDSPEDQLLIQVQGIIAEYERAQIRERSRRGRLHRAREGSVSVLGDAPYGFKYHKKTPFRDAFYEIDEKQAQAVRLMFHLFVEESQSIAAVTRTLNDKEIPTRTGKKPWERSTVWGILRNPAFKGMAAYGKTELTGRQKVTRRIRQRGGWSPRDGGRRTKEPKEWTPIPVPAIIDETTFELAQELLKNNKRFADRNSKKPTLLRGLVICGECSYAYFRKSNYYRCIGTQGERFHNGPVCRNRGVRQDQLESLVWDKLLELLSTPELIHNELEERRTLALDSAPSQKRRETLLKELARVQRGIDKLLDAYQDSLLNLSELRDRIPELRKKAETIEAELQALDAAEIDQSTLSQFQETVDTFKQKMQKNAQTLDIHERQKIIRLLVKEILIYEEKITIRHSIPATKTPNPQNVPLCTGSGPPAQGCEGLPGGRGELPWDLKTIQDQHRRCCVHSQ